MPTPRTRGRTRPRAIVLLVAGLWLVAAPTAAVAMAWPLVAPDRMLVIGHSGDVAHWPRNSYKSVVSAAQSNADGLEFDVDRSADGTWWLFHDGDLASTTTGEGQIHSRIDAELATVRIDAGMGVDPARQGGYEGLATLSDVLDALSGYRGVIIVDCKDERPGAHGALARYLLDRGLITSVIARSGAGAAEVKAVDRRFRVLTQQLLTYDPNVDVWLADAGYQVKPPQTTIGDLFGELGMFVGDSHWREDERPYLEAGRRWGVQFVIANDIAAAIAWRDGVAD